MGQLTLLGAGKPPAASAFVPTDIASLIGWFKADTQVHNTGTTAATDGQTVNNWHDQSGNNYDVAINFNNPPTFRSTGFNGLPCVEYSSAANQALRTTYDTVAIGTGNTASIFMVGTFNTGATSGGPGIVGNGQTNPAVDVNSGGFGFNAAGTKFDCRHAFDDRGDTTASLDTNYRFGLILDGTNVTLYLNNVAGTPAALSWSWTSPGGFWLTNTGFAGKIAECCFFNDDLSSGDRNSLDSYFTTKWGL